VVLGARCSVLGARLRAGPVAPCAPRLVRVSVPERLRSLLAQDDHACDRLVRRMAGPAFDSGNGVLLQVDAMSDGELLWEPVPGCWSVRPRSQGPRTLRRDQHLSCGQAAEAVAGFGRAVAAWREAVVSAGDAELDEVGRSTYPHGSDAGEPFIDVVWWVNQEVLHHGAEIALLRDLYRAFSG